MKRILLILAMAVVTSFTVMAQSDPVVLEVDGQQIRQKEFMKEFKAVVGDNLSRKAGVTAAEKHKALTDYVDLYANFRAKVADARSEERPHVSTSDNVILDDDRAKIIKDAETAIKNEEIWNASCAATATSWRVPT